MPSAPRFRYDQALKLNAIQGSVHPMGDSKRRQQTLGENYGKEEKIAPWLPLTKTQTTQFVEITTKGAWIGMGLMVGGWIVIRFVGPFFGWWQLVG
jgi:Protein of unknown function (DUF2839)